VSWLSEYKAKVHDGMEGQRLRNPGQTPPARSLLFFIFEPEGAPSGPPKHVSSSVMEGCEVECETGCVKGRSPKRRPDRYGSVGDPLDAAVVEVHGAAGLRASRHRRSPRRFRCGARPRWYGARVLRHCWTRLFPLAADQRWRDAGLCLPASRARQAPPKTLRISKALGRGDVLRNRMCA
jgi:hypothetical protein